MHFFFLLYSSECGGYLRATNQTQYFYSHSKFGHRPYRKNTYCVWKIQADEDASVKLEFISFEIEYSRKCSYDYVEISEDDNLIHPRNHGKFCGHKVL